MVDAGRGSRDFFDGGNGYSRTRLWCFQVDESIVRFLVLQVRKLRELDRVIEVGTCKMKS